MAPINIYVKISILIFYAVNQNEKKKKLAVSSTYVSGKLTLFIETQAKSTHLEEERKSISSLILE